MTLKNYEREERPWGAFERFTLNEPSTIKVISVHPNEALSLQRHEKRSEYWRVLSGSGFVTLGDSRTEARTGDEFEVAPGMLHRIEAGSDGLTFLEISFGEFDEDDEERVEDKYGRS
jgi:mannose-6-phosphate isomerase-like protein (cupin superfamily)